MLCAGVAALNLVLLAGPAPPTPERRAVPSPPPTIADQDEVDLTGRSNIVLGVGARALGMGGAFLARPDDATAASWNPAGLSYLRRPEVSVVADHLAFDVTAPDAISEFRSHTLDFVAVTYPLALGGGSGSAQVSYQRAIGFNGERVTERNDRTIKYDGTGGFDVLALGVGWKITRTLRIGGTLNRWFDGYEQTTVRTPSRRTVRNDTFGISGLNVNVGLIWSPLEALNLGAVGKTPFTMKVNLDRRRTDFVSEEGEPDFVTSNAFHNSAVRLDFPGAWGLGASWRPRSTLTVAADYTRTYWSKAVIHNYFTLLQDPPGGINTFDVLPWPTIEDDSQADALQIRLGAELVVFRGRVKVPLRAGYVNDQQYVKDVNGEAPHFNAFTLGSGLIVGSMLLDVAYLHESGDFTDKNGQATRATTNRLYASLIYRWGGIR